MKEYKSKWYPLRRCVQCHRRLSDHEYAYSYGVCPKCGHKGKHSSLVECYETIVRDVFSGPLWNRHHRHEVKE